MSATKELRALQDRAAQTRARRRDEQRRWRAGLAARGLAQVTGIYAPPALHATIRACAAKIVAQEHGVYAQD